MSKSKFNGKESSFRDEMEPEVSTNKGGNRGKGRGANRRNNGGRNAANRNAKNGRGGKPSTGSRSDSKYGLNDFSWYNNYPDLIEAAARLQYPKIPGMNYDLPNVEVASLNSDGFFDWNETGIRYQNIPGIMSLDWAPSVGASNDAQSPASLVAKELYAKIRSKFSGSLDEDAPDLFMYMMALDSVFSLLSYYKRIYRVMNTYHPLTTSIPDGVLHAMGFNDEHIMELRSNRVEFWGRLNDMIRKSAKFICPDVMSYMTRHYWMSQNIYLDADSPKGQIYMFNMKAYYQVDPYTNTGTSLKMKLINFEGVRADSLLDYMFNLVNDALNALADWDDGYTISGHLMRAFEGSNAFVVGLQDENETMGLIHQPEVLTQIENSRCVIPIYDAFAMAVNRGWNDVTQDPTTNAVLSRPCYAIDIVRDNRCAAFMPNTEYIINMRWENPTPQDNIIATRLLNTYMGPAGNDTDTESIGVIDCGTEVVLRYNIYFYSPTARVWSNFDCSSLLNRNRAVMSMLPFWDWHPIFIEYTEGSTPDDISPLYFAEFQNANTFGTDIIKDMHRVCVLSEFNAFSII